MCEANVFLNAVHSKVLENIFLDYSPEISCPRKAP
jgi:hypothetical protein